MRCIFLQLLLVVVITSTSYSQSLVSENKYWSVVNFGTIYGSDYESFYIKFKGDTIISDIQYKRVFRSNDSLRSNWSSIGSIRETDTGSVYFLEDKKSNEILILDFSVEEGDSVKLEVEFDQYLYVDSIRYLPFGIFNEFRKHIYLSRSHHYEEIWIEGVGSPRGILFDPRNLGSVGLAEILVCFTENDSLKFHSEHFTTCFPTGKYTQIEKAIANPSVSIMNHKDVLIFDLDGVYNESLFRLVDISGRTLLTRRIQESSFSLEKSKYENGIYIYIIHSPKEYHCGKFIIN